MTQSIHPSAAQGFRHSAELYQQVRPSYPAEIAAWLQQYYQTQTEPHCMDLGAGTGKFLPTLQSLTPHILAIEPIDQMRAELQAQYPNINCQAGLSHALPCVSQSIDAVFCAQAFHWFANTESLDEMARVLKAQGDLFLIWNQRDLAVDWVNAIAKLIYPLEGNTPRYHSGQWQKVIQTYGGFTEKNQLMWRFDHVGTVEQVVSKRLMSTSFIAALSDLEQLNLKQQIEQIVQRYTGLNATDEIAFPYVTHLYHYQKTL